MAYVHSNLKMVPLSRDPIDPDSTDWVYFSYQNWLRPDESITAHSALIEGGTIETDSVAVQTVQDSVGDSYSDTYAVEITPAAGASVVVVTHRITTTVGGAVDLGRTNIDHSVTIRVKHL